MRGIRWLLVAAVFLIGAVALTYHSQRRAQELAAPPPPEALPHNVDAEGLRWTYTQTDGDRTVAELGAGRMQKLSDPSSVQLEDVDLRVFDPDGRSYDQVRSAFATFDTDSGVLFSEADVEIIVGIPADGSAPDDPVTIRSSGVRFNLETGEASTEQPASFVFSGGEGRSVGAAYFSESGELRMLSDVELHGRGEFPLTVRAGQLTYREDEAIIHLSPWSRLERDSMVLNAATSDIVLENGEIQNVHAEKAEGTSKHGDRTLAYSAESMQITFADANRIERIEGQGDGHVSASSEESVTEVSGDLLVLDFTPTRDDSLLKTAVAIGSGVLESRPAPGRTAPPPTRVMRSENLTLTMLPDGRQIQQIETGAPGSIEFVPNVPGQPHRRLDGSRLWIRYAADNRIESFRATGVSTRTQPATEEGKDPQPPLLTWSNDLEATFDPETEEMVRLVQWMDFRFEEGQRRGNAERAELDAVNQIITLTKDARLTDEAGSTAASTIVLHQEDGGLTAAGNVSSTRVAESAAAPGGLLGKSEPLHATANSMQTSDNSRTIVYEGDAVVWQGWNRLEADRVEIDRDARTLEAEGGVVTRVGESPQSEPAVNAGVVYTIIHAGELSYQDEDRLAHYRGGVKLERSGLEMNARELRAWFLQPEEGPEPAGSQLKSAFADGAVTLASHRGSRDAQGSSERAEYYPAEEKLILLGGRPKLTDAVRGTTEGDQLTYFPADDRLFVDGTEAQPAVSQLLRGTP